MSTYVVAALYHFTPLPDFAERCEGLLVLMQERDVFGLVLLAHEGVNGNIAGSRAGIDAILAHIRTWPGCADLVHNESHADTPPFHRQKVKLRKEIVTIGIPNVDPNEIVGEYIAPQDWNALISDPNIVLIDTRNDFEVQIGTFKNAVNPKTTSFRDFPGWVQNNEQLDPAKTRVAMFCTGGIRCEKASSYMRQEGFAEVFHLKGGILKYLEEIPADESLWEGDCFVFDERVSVGHGLAVGTYDVCRCCRALLGDEERASPVYIKGVQCPSCHDKIDDDKRARLKERQKQVTLAKERGQAHIGSERFRRPKSDS